MRNLHVIPTPNPSRLYKDLNNRINITDIEMKSGDKQNIYITSDEEIKEWFIVNGTNGYSLPMKYSVMFPKDKFPNGHNKTRLSLLSIILTTDQDLIKDGVQPIPNEFLEWFVKNPSCEYVEFEFNNRGITGTEKILKTFGEYKIIIPKEEPNYNMKQEILAEMERLEEEPKQETLEEIDENKKNLYYYKQVMNPYPVEEYSYTAYEKGFIEGYQESTKWQAERSYSEKDMLKFAQKYAVNTLDKSHIEQFKKK